MDSSLVGIGILVAVGLMAVMAYMFQKLENARVERQRRILAILEGARQARNYLTGLPTAYLPADIRSFLIIYLQKKYQEILEIDPNHKEAHAQLAKVKELSSVEYKSNPDSAEPIFKDAETLKRTAIAVKEMVNFLVNLHKEGDIDKAQAQKFINKGKALYALIGVDNHQISAKQAEDADNIKMAMNHYMHCWKKLQPFVKAKQMPERTQFIKAKVSELKPKMPQPAASSAATPNPSRQSEWDDFNSPENTGRIKQDYE